MEDLKFIVESQSPEAVLARQMIGVENIALMMAKIAIAKFRNVELNTSVVSQAFGITKNGAWKKVDNIEIRTSSSNDTAD